MIKQHAREYVYARSGGWCEAMVKNNNGIWNRCRNQGMQIHHMLTVGRGGALLDDVSETYHLIHLCVEHHAGADGGLAYDGDLLIDGQVISFGGKPVYLGTDEFLTTKYPRRDLEAQRAAR